ncbi:hypothetical protein ABZ826_18175 [Streptomyces sp. NPDC047515]|uniref:hypothetical protein n=1 Tax=Streptomyces sp. NPDC047515 TaxID=3155380 RepID=UPI0033DE6936
MTRSPREPAGRRRTKNRAADGREAERDALAEEIVGPASQLFERGEMDARLLTTSRAADGPKG